MNHKSTARHPAAFMINKGHMFTLKIKALYIRTFSCSYSLKLVFSLFYYNVYLVS
jgi:hypothetical protein